MLVMSDDHSERAAVSMIVPVDYCAQKLWVRELVMKHPWVDAIRR
jgi:hypothetical protein